MNKINHKTSISTNEDYQEFNKSGNQGIIKSSFLKVITSFFKVISPIEDMFKHSKLKGHVKLNEELSDIDQRLNALATKPTNPKTVSEAKPPQPHQIIATLPDVPKEGIRVGLPNINDHGGFGNTCWLNSILKFVSSGTEFDSMLVQIISPAATHAQTQFRNIVTTLRTGTTPEGLKVKSIPESMYINFLKSLKELKKPDRNEPIIPRDRGVGSQQDANEYLQAFGKAFEWQPFIDNTEMQNIVNEQKNFPRQATLFTPANSTPKEKVKTPKHDPSMAFVTLNLPSHLLNQPSQTIKIPDLTEEREIREVRHIAENRNSGNYDWSIKKCFTCLPPTMIVSLNRAVLSDNINELLNPAVVQKKVNNHVHINKDGLITFIEYKPIYEKENIIGCVPNKVCYYRIETALTHLGGASSGHYICEERTATGLTIEHSDMQVEIANKGMRFGVLGSLLRLKRVKEETYQEFSNITSGGLKTFEECLNYFETENSIESIPLDMQKALLKHYKTLIREQKASNFHTGEVISNFRREELVQKYENNANFLLACMASLDQN